MESFHFKPCNILPSLVFFGAIDSMCLSGICSTSGVPGASCGRTGGWFGSTAAFLAAPASCVSTSSLPPHCAPVESKPISAALSHLVVPPPPAPAAPTEPLPGDHRKPLKSPLFHFHAFVPFDCIDLCPPMQPQSRHVACAPGESS